MFKYGCMTLFPHCSLMIITLLPTVQIPDPRTIGLNAARSRGLSRDDEPATKRTAIERHLRSAQMTCLTSSNWLVPHLLYARTHTHAHTHTHTHTTHARLLSAPYPRWTPLRRSQRPARLRSPERRAAGPERACAAESGEL